MLYAIAIGQIKINAIPESLNDSWELEELESHLVNMLVHLAEFSR